MRVSTASAVAVGLWSLCAGCASLDRADAEVEVEVAALVEGGCADGPSRGLPSEIDAVVVERASGDGWQRVERVPVSDGEVVLTGLEVGEAALRLVACAGDAPRLVAEPGPVRVDDAGKSVVTVRFAPSGRLACAGTGRGEAYDRYAGPARPRIFAATAPLGPGRVLVAGGADTVEGGRLSVGDLDAGWEVFEAAEALFVPGVDRARPLDPRRLDAPRVAAEAVAWRAAGGDRDGVLIIGGAPTVTRGRFPFGPLAPGADGVTPGAVFFDAERGSVAPVRFEGEALAPRFMAGTGVDEAGRVLRVGGVGETSEPSDRVELIADGVLSVAALPVDPDRQARVEAGEIDVRLARHVLVGASVTAIGDGRFLVWGGDYNGCGAAPGWLVTASSGAPTIARLTIDGPEAPPVCGDPLRCRVWYSTGYHTASPLPPAPDGAPRVLIAGGLPLGSRNVLGSPDPGAACGPNAFIATIDVGAEVARVEPVTVDGAAAASLKRALHRAVTVDDAVLLMGGWVAGDDPAAFEGTAEVLRYAAGRFELIDDRLAAARFGGFAAAVPGGGAVSGGGLDGATALDTAEVYTPALPAEVCAE